MQERREDDAVQAGQRAGSDAAELVQLAVGGPVDHLDDVQDRYDRAHGHEGAAQRGVERVGAKLLLCLAGGRRHTFVGTRPAPVPAIGQPDRAARAMSTAKAETRV